MNNATPQPTAALDAGLANLREYGYTIHPGFIDGHRLVQLRERLLEQADMERELVVGRKCNRQVLLDDAVATARDKLVVEA